MAELYTEVLFRLSETLQMMQNTLQCVICLDFLRNPVSTRCGHPFCRDCITNLLKSKKSGRAPCPLCNATVTRRSLSDNEKLQRMVRGVLDLISAIEKDTGVQIMIQSRHPRNSSREAFSPKNLNKNSTVVNKDASTSGLKRVGGSNKVETWLLKMPPPNASQETETQAPVTAPLPTDSDSDDMVSVSQIPPERGKNVPEKSGATEFDKLMLNYHQKMTEEQRLKTQASNHIEDDGETGSGDFSPSEEEWAPTKVKTRRSIRNQAGESITSKHPKSSVTKKTNVKSTSKKRGNPNKNKNTNLSQKEAVNKLFGIKQEGDTNTEDTKSDKLVKGQVKIEKLVGNEKENLAVRSPGWSRLEKVKKDFHDPRNSALKHLSTHGLDMMNHTSPVPSIEDEVSSTHSEDIPCLSLTVCSPDIRKKKLINDIVSSLESEIELCEKSCSPSYDGPNGAHLVKTPSLRVVVERKTKRLSSPIGSKESKDSSGNKLNQSKKNSVPGIVRLHAPEASLEPTVSFLKLGPMRKRKIMVRFCLMGRLSRAKTTCHQTIIPPKPCMVDAEVQTSLERDLPYTQPSSSSLSSPFYGINPQRKSVDNEYKNARISSGGDVDTIMDAETVIFSQPLRRVDTVNVAQCPRTSDDAKQTSDNKTSKNLTHKPQSEEDKNKFSRVQEGNILDIFDSHPDNTCFTQINNSFALDSKEDAENVIPLNEISKTRTPSKDSKHRPLKRIRSATPSVESSDSDEEFFQKSSSRKKKKNRPLSYNEDSSDSPMNEPDMSLLEGTSDCPESIMNRIKANIEADLKGTVNDFCEDSLSHGAKTCFSPNWYNSQVSGKENQPKDEDSDCFLALTPNSSKPTKPPAEPLTPKTQRDMFDDTVRSALEASKAQMDSDSDPDVLVDTPQKQNPICIRLPVDAPDSLSEDIVPSSQPTTSALNMPLPNRAHEKVVIPLEPVEVISEEMSADVTFIEQIPPQALSPKKSSVSVSAAPKQDVSVHGPCPPSVPIRTGMRDLQLNARKKFGFACSGLPPPSVSDVTTLAKLLGAEFSPTFEPSVTTHLIVRANSDSTTAKTLKYLNAVATGKWIVSFNWVLACLNEKKLLPEEPFEVIDSSGEPGPKRSRNAKEKLFHNFEFCCCGPFADLTKEQLEGLLIACGATIVPEPSKFSFKKDRYCIILAQWEEDREEEFNSWLEQYCAPVVQHDWVLECIGRYSITSFWLLLSCDVSEEKLSSMGYPAFLIDSSDADSTVA